MSFQKAYSEAEFLQYLKHELNKFWRCVCRRPEHIAKLLQAYLQFHVLLLQRVLYETIQIQHNATGNCLGTLQNGKNDRKMFYYKALSLTFIRLRNSRSKNHFPFSKLYDLQLENKVLTN